MGIPGNLDLPKRKIAQEAKDRDFGSIYFTMPNGNIYIGEPFSNQKQLPRLNYADRDWYKGVTALNNTYISCFSVYPRTCNSNSGSSLQHWYCC
jgi:hypothetical protein